MKPDNRFSSWDNTDEIEEKVAPEPVEAEETPAEPEVCPKRIANDIRNLEKGETFCEDAHGDVYSAVYGILRKEKLQEPLSYKDGKIFYVKN